MNVNISTSCNQQTAQLYQFTQCDRYCCIRIRWSVINKRALLQPQVSHTHWNFASSLYYSSRIRYIVKESLNKFLCVIFMFSNYIDQVICICQSPEKCTISIQCLLSVGTILEYLHTHTHPRRKETKQNQTLNWCQGLSDIKTRNQRQIENLRLMNKRFDKMLIFVWSNWVSLWWIVTYLCIIMDSIRNWIMGSNIRSNYVDRNREE